MEQHHRSVVEADTDVQCDCATDQLDKDWLVASGQAVQHVVKRSDGVDLSADISETHQH